MTFSELVEAMEARFPNMEYSVSVEFDQESNRSRACEHEPKVRRSLAYKVKVNYVTYEGGSPEETLNHVDRSKNQEVTKAALDAVDAPKVKEPF